jgi:hypothetical protein
MYTKRCQLKNRKELERIRDDESEDNEPLMKIQLMI